MRREFTVTATNRAISFSFEIARSNEPLEIANEPLEIANESLETASAIESLESIEPVETKLP